MQHVASLVIGAEFRSRVAGLANRLGSVSVVAEPGWQRLADQFDLAQVATNGARVLIVGPPAAVLRHATTVTDGFGFVMPDAQLAKPWQRAPRWRDDATLGLWKLGWSPTSIDRLLVPVRGATIEYVIGGARPTPELALALDDAH